MKKFIGATIIIIGVTFGLVKGLEGLDDSMAGSATTTTVFPGLPPAAFAPQADQEPAAAPAPTGQTTRRSSPAAPSATSAPAQATPAAVPATTTAPKVTTTTAAPITTTTTTTVEQPVCTLTLSNSNPSAGEMVTATIASNQRNEPWHARINPNGSNSRGEGGTTDGNGATHFSWAVQAWDNGQVRAEVGLAKYGYSPEGSFARCTAQYTVR